MIVFRTVSCPSLAADRHVEASDCHPEALAAYVASCRGEAGRHGRVTDSAFLDGWFLPKLQVCVVRRRLSRLLRKARTCVREPCPKAERFCGQETGEDRVDGTGIGEDLWGRS